MRLASLLLLILLIIPSTVFAQDGDTLTCDEGPNDAINAAQAALDAGDLDLALELAQQAEALCATNVMRYTTALSLRTGIELEIEKAKQNALRAAAWPGMVDLGDYALFMQCEGAGSPTVIFENGYDTSLETWDTIREEAAAMTRVCFYDHLGVGLSNLVPAGTQRTTQDQVDDLHQLLALAEIEPPYVFVGHSNGGYNQLLYSHNYPDEVVGHLLIDTYHPEFVKPYFQPGQIIGGERLDRYTSSEQVEQLTSLGDRPVAVISADHPDTEVQFPGDIWMPLQEELAALSTNSRYIVSESSAHDVQRYYPDLVLEALRWVLDETMPALAADLVISADADGDWDLYRVHAGTGDWTAITATDDDEIMPVWMPGADVIGFDRLVDNFPLVHRINVDGSDDRQLVDAAGQNGWMGWSPDGSQIAFFSARAGGPTLWVMDADGGNQHEISTQTPAYEPDWSPDGTRIAFIGQPVGVGEVFVLDLLDGSTTQLTDNGSVEDWDPDWSPDGSRIVFTRNEGNNADLYVMDADGGNVRRLTSHPARDGFAAWSPDGSQIVFCSERGGSWDVWVMQADGSFIQQVTFDPGDERGVDWQR